MRDITGQPLCPPLPANPRCTHSAALQGGRCSRPAGTRIHDARRGLSEGGCCFLVALGKGPPGSAGHSPGLHVHQGGYVHHGLTDVAPKALGVLGGRRRASLKAGGAAPEGHRRSLGEGDAPWPRETPALCPSPEWLLQTAGPWPSPQPTRRSSGALTVSGLENLLEM